MRPAFDDKAPAVTVAMRPARASPPRALVVGMSHVAVIQRAAAEAPNPDLRIVNLMRSRAAPPEVDPAAVRALFLSIKGNFHAIFALFDGPAPFYTADASGALTVDDRAGRAFVPRDMLRAHFEAALADVKAEMAAGIAHYPNARAYCLAPPPPKGDDAHIRKFPGEFAAMMDRPLAPRGQRLEAYRLQTGIYRAFCRELGARLIAPPARTIGADGFMEPRFHGWDPVHANKRYGGRVLRQIERRMAKIDA